MRKVLALFALTASLGCSSGLSGDYGGEGCIYQKMSFKGGGTVYVSIMGIEQEAKYKVDGDRVSLTSADGKSIVFRKDGDALTSDFLGQKMSCKKL